MEFNTAGDLDGPLRRLVLRSVSRIIYKEIYGVHEKWRAAQVFFAFWLKWQTRSREAGIQIIDGWCALRGLMAAKIRFVIE